MGKNIGGEKMKRGFLKWLKAAGIRAIKTVAETALATIGSTAVISQIDWKLTLSAALLSGVLSLLVSIKGLPELNS